MAAEILNAGRSYFAQKQAANQPAIINKMIFANVPGLNPATAINLDEAMPPAGQIVAEVTIPPEYRGFVSPDRVVYSSLLGPTVGPFNYNWVGLVTDTNILAAVSHIPLSQKYGTVGGVLGNTLTRNFLIEYQNIQSITGITVEAGTWQVDFVARFNQQQELMRNLANDFYGKQFFLDDGFKVVRSAGAWKISPGVGYVSGVRISNLALVNFEVPSLPADVWIDVYIDKSISSVEAVFTVAALPVGTALNNYTAPNSVVHYVAKIATLTNTLVFADNRKKTSTSESGIVGGQQGDWAAFLAQFYSTTDFIKLNSNNQLARKNKYFSAGGLSHTLPNTSQSIPVEDRLFPGDVILVRKKAGDEVAYFVFNSEIDRIFYDSDIDTAINHNVDNELAFLWTGERWECSI